MLQDDVRFKIDLEVFSRRGLPSPEFTHKVKVQGGRFLLSRDLYRTQSGDMELETFVEFAPDVAMPPDGIYLCYEVSGNHAYYDDESRFTFD